MKKQIEYCVDNTFGKKVVSITFIDSNGYGCETASIWCDEIYIEKNFIVLKNNTKDIIGYDEIVSLFVNNEVNSIIEYDNITNHNIIKRIK